MKLEQPNRIYHYTNIDTLQKILNNRTLRFNRFDLMDDRTETEGLPKELKQSYFLSCWLSEEWESIPQWAMYASEGVRISLPRIWYIKHPIPIAGQPGESITEVEHDMGFRKMDCFFPFPFEASKREPWKFVIPPFDQDDGFCLKVEYRKDFYFSKKDRWNYVGQDNNNCDWVRSTVGVEGRTIEFYDHESFPIRYKDIYWQFQQEFRFFLRFNIGSANDFHCKAPDFLDLPVSVEAFNTIKITLYPNCTKEDESKVIELVRKYLPELDPANVVKRSLLDDKWKSKSSETDCG